MTIGWGIVGLGIISDRSFGPAVKAAEGAHLAAACSRTLSKAEEFVAKHGPGAAYDSYDKMLADPNVQAVYIATPNYLHKDDVLKAAAAGKNILCEKPMALTFADSEEMVAACRANNVKIAINFPSRFNPVNVEARRLIKEGVLGRIYFAKTQACYWVPGDTTKDPNVAGTGAWRIDPAKAGAGALMGPGLHPIDLMRFLMDTDIEEVTALLEPQGDNVVDSMEYIIFKYADGTRGVSISGLQIPQSDNGFILYGDKAKMTCGSLGPGKSENLHVEGEAVTIDMSFNPAQAMAGTQINVINYFSRCIAEDIEPAISSGENGSQMVKIVNAIVESSRSGRAIKLADM